MGAGIYLRVGNRDQLNSNTTCQEGDMLKKMEGKTVLTLNEDKEVIVAETVNEVFGEK